MVPEGLVTVLVYPVAPSRPGHEFLLLRRTADLGGFWQGVSGSVERGESLEETAVRRLIEATRLHPAALISTHYSNAYAATKRPRPHPPSRHPIKEHVFLAALEARLDPIIDPTVHDAWAWFSFDDALGWLRQAETREALRRCEDLLTKSSKAST